MSTDNLPTPSQTTSPELREVTQARIFCAKMAFATLLVVLYAVGTLPEWALMSAVCGMGFTLYRPDGARVS